MTQSGHRGHPPVGRRRSRACPSVAHFHRHRKQGCTATRTPTAASCPALFP